MNKDANHKKPYESPQITHELALETRAGSPIGDLGTDPLGIQETRR